jgi:hypothetical protein
MEDEAIDDLKYDEANGEGNKEETIEWQADMMVISRF